MKFQVQQYLKECLINPSAQARIGKLTLKSGIECETPGCLLYSTSGGAPNITADLLNLLPHKPNIIEIPLPTVVDSVDTLKKHDCSLQKFIKMENFSVLMTINDPIRPITAGYDEGKKIAMWTPHGKRLIDTAKFQEIVKTFNVEYVECAYDGATALNCPKKRLSKASDRTKVFVDECFNEKNLNDQDYIMPLVGGWCEKTRTAFLNYILNEKFKFNCVSFNGFQTDTKLEDFDFDNIAPLIKSTFDEISKSSEYKNDEIVRYFSIPWRPDNVIKAVDIGIDLFSGSYPHILTQRSEALVFSYKYEEIENEEEEEEEEDRPLKKKRKISESEIRKTIINIHEEKYKNDFEPILNDCYCYTCKYYTKAYVNHLFENKELVGQTLLMIHNTSHYFSFFNEIRNKIKTKNFDKYKKYILKQFST